MKYLYRPYHPWRHGYRRERFEKGLFQILKVVLVLELLILTGRYIKEHTFEYVYEREVTSELEMKGQDGIPGISDGEDDIFGIGIGDEGLFWFHKETQQVEK